MSNSKFADPNEDIKDVLHPKKNAASHCQECGLPGHTSRNHDKKIVEMLSFASFDDGNQNGIRRYCRSFIFPGLTEAETRGNAGFFFFGQPVTHENWLAEKGYAARIEACPGTNFFRLITTHYAYIVANHLCAEIVYLWGKNLSTGVFVSLSFIFFFLSPSSSHHLLPPGILNSEKRLHEVLLAKQLEITTEVKEKALAVIVKKRKAKDQNPTAPPAPPAVRSGPACPEKPGRRFVWDRPGTEFQSQGGRIPVYVEAKDLGPVYELLAKLGKEEKVEQEVEQEAVEVEGEEEERWLGGALNLGVD